MIQSPYTRHRGELRESAGAILAVLAGRPMKSGVPWPGQTDALEVELAARTTGSPASAAKGHSLKVLPKSCGFDRISGSLEAICEFEKGLAPLFIRYYRIVQQIHDYPIPTNMTGRCNRIDFLRHLWGKRDAPPDSIHAGGNHTHITNIHQVAPRMTRVCRRAKGSTAKSQSQSPPI
jgi:hypothetical protein